MHKPVKYALIQSSIPKQQPTHLLSFTSILSLLSIQNPQISSQLNTLRSAVTAWYNQIQQKMHNKNISIMAARTRGYEKLAIYLNDVETYFKNLLRVYDDPNLAIYFRQFKKIKEEFQFIDVDFDKFYDKFREKQVQTDKQNMFMLGVDVQKLLNRLQIKQNQLDQSKKVITDIDRDNQQLKQQIHILIQQMKKDEDDFFEKIKCLREQLEKARAEVHSTRSQTQNKNFHNYRSNPQIPLSQRFSNRKIIKNLLINADQHSYPVDQQSSNDQDINIKGQQPELYRFMYCQAVTLQGMLQSIQAYENA